MSETRQAWLKGSFAMLTINLGQRTVGLISIMILARLLDPRGLGAYTFSQTVAQSFAGWTRFGLDAGTHVCLAGTNDRYRVARIIGQSLTVALIIATVGAGALIASADIVADRLFHTPELAPFVIPAAVMFAGLTLFGVIYAIHAGLGTFGAFAWTAAGGAVSALVLSVAGAVAVGPIGAAWGLAFGQIVTMLLAADAMRRVLREREIGLKLALPGREAADIILLGLPFFSAALFIFPADLIGMSLLARDGGADVLGQLRVTQAIIAIASTLPSAMVGPIVTYLASEYASGRGDAQVRLQIKLLWSLSLLIAVALAGVWPIAVDFVAANAFLQARQIGDLALTTFIPAMLLSVLQGALLARRRFATRLLAVGALQALVLTAAAYLLIPRFGLAGYFAAQTCGFWVASGAAAFALSGRGVLGARAALLGAITFGFYAVLLIDQMQPSELSTRIVAAIVIGAFMMGVFYRVILTAAERARLTVIVRLTMLRVMRRR